MILEVDGGDWSYVDLRLTDLRGARLSGAKLVEAHSWRDDCVSCGLDLPDGAWRITYAVAGRRILLLTVFRKQRRRESAKRVARDELGSDP